MSIKVIQVSSIVCPTPDIDTVNIISAARQERVCANMSPVTICVPQGVQGAQGPQGPQGIQGPAGPQGEPGQGVPTGGAAGQVLAKVDGTDYNTHWIDQSGGGLENPVDHIDFVATPADDVEPRRLQWNADAGTLDLGMDVAGVTLQVGQELFFRVKNQTGSAIADGTLVMAAGTTGNSGRILVAPSINDGSVPGHMLLGIVTHSLTDGADGFATHFGQVRGINTTGAGVGETWADGDLLYPNPAQVGKLTKVLPTGAGLKNPIAIVIHAHSNGSIFVRMSPGHEAQAVVTYAELVAKISASTLIPGLQYLINDFRSSWYHLDGGTPINDPQYGSIEPIVVTAIAANKIASLAYSTVYPSDVIYYDWNAANWNTDNFYSIGSTIIPGWRGVITERIDTLRNNRATFNFRVMTFRRWGITAPAYNSGTTYNLGDVVKSGNFLFLCKRYDTTGVATSNAERWIPVLGGVNINTSKFWATGSSGIGFDIPDIDNYDVGYMQINGDGTSQDYLAFPIDSLNMNIVGDKQASLSAANVVVQGTSFNVNSAGSNCTIGTSAGVVIEPNVSDCYIPSTNVGLSIRAGSARVVCGTQCGIDITSNNSVFGDFCRLISGQVRYSFIGRDSDYSNINVANCEFSAIGYSIITDMQFCRFSKGCFSSQFGGAAFNNKFLEAVFSCSFGFSVYDNVFTGYVSNSKFGDEFYGNQFASVSYCDFYNLFSGNIFNAHVEGVVGGLNFTDDDYSSATEIYQPGAKTLLLNRNGDKRLQYVDASDNIVIVSNLA